MISIILAIADDEERILILNLYLKYEKNLYLTAKKVLENPIHAEDCVHDTIKGVIENLEKFKTLDNEHQLKYMMVSCRNAAINKYNKKDKIAASLNEGYDDGSDEKLALDDVSVIVIR